MLYQASPGQYKSAGSGIIRRRASGGVRSVDDESGGRPPVSASIVSEKTEL